MTTPSVHDQHINGCPIRPLSLSAQSAQSCSSSDQFRTAIELSIFCSVYAKIEHNVPCNLRCLICCELLATGRWDFDFASGDHEGIRSVGNFPEHSLVLLCYGRFCRAAGPPPIAKPDLTSQTRRCGLFADGAGFRLSGCLFPENHLVDL